MLGALLVAAVGCALLILAWHMPSDVLGGYLLATLWAALAVAALRAGEPTQTGSGLDPALCAPGAHSDSGPSFVARLRMNNMSDNRFR
jgi:membrane-associated phospholipid phosphatase